MKKNLICAALAMLWFALILVPAKGQTVAVRVNGTVTDNGKPAPGLKVVLTNTENGKTYNTKTDKNGKFDLVGIYGGSKFTVQVFSATGESLFKRDNVQVAGEGGAPDVMAIDVSNQTNTNLGMSNEAAVAAKSKQETGQPKYTKEQIEEIKKQNEKAQGANALIQQATNAMNAKNWQEAMAPLQQLVALDPGNWQYSSALGDTYLNLGQFDQAVESYEKGIQAAESNTTIDPKNPATDPVKKKSGIAKMLTNEGNAYLKLHKNKEAVDAYTKAAVMDPNPAVAYFNLCATQYNTGNAEGALAACDKAIAADPNKADAYYIKGSMLIASSTTDKEGKVTAPPGTAETLNKYLELAPDGVHAADVKQMLAYIGSKIETTYKKRGK